MALLAVNLETMNIDDFITPEISFIIYHFREYTKAKEITL